MRLKVGLNRFLSLCALLLAVPALAASQPVSGDAVASQTVTIRNEAWAGYGVSGSPFPTPSEPKKELYKRVTGSWQMPGESEISCGSGEHSKAAFWVGLGGVSDLEQI